MEGLDDSSLDLSISKIFSAHLVAGSRWLTVGNVGPTSLAAFERQMLLYVLPLEALQVPGPSGYVGVSASVITRKVRGMGDGEGHMRQGGQGEGREEKQVMTHQRFSNSCREKTLNLTEGC